MLATLLVMLPAAATVPYFWTVTAVDVERIKRGEVGYTTPVALREQAREAARHAIEHDLPAGPWYQLEAFWDLAGDGLIGHDEPELSPAEARVERLIEAVEALPSEHEPGPGFEFDMDAFVERTKRKHAELEEKATKLEKAIAEQLPVKSGRRYKDPRLQREAEAGRAERARRDWHEAEYRAGFNAWQPVKAEKEIVVRLPGQDVLRSTWQLTGTDEDAHVLEALRNHGVTIGREGLTAHLAGSREAVQAAQAEYRVGFNARRAKRRG